MKRRTFIKSSVACAAVAIHGSRLHAANEEIRLGVIGVGSTVKIGGKGRHDIRQFLEIPGVRVTAVCDCDAAHLDWQVQKSAEWGDSVKAYRDFRKLLDDPDIDAVSITTPNHWHSLMVILACQAGKHVFVQKPMSHNLFEGRKAVEAAKKYRRCVQAVHGPRGSGAALEAFQYARDGQLGKILYAHGVNYRPRQSIGNVDGPQPIPKTVDYHLWCGPAKKEPLRREHLHYDWHWDWNTGSGDLGNMGIHYMDACRWGLGLQTLPNRVVTAGGRLGYVDDGETPNTLITLLDYEETPVIFEVRGLPKNASHRDATWRRNMDQYKGISIGTILFCEGGTIRLNTNGSCAAYDNSGEKIRDFTNQRESPKENFINAVRAEDPSMLYTDATEGHLSCGLVHMTNIAYRVGASTSPSVVRERMQEEKPLGEATERMLEHIRANNIDFEETPLRVGPVLQFDPKSERFVGPMSDAANPLVAREYRKPFVVPNKV